MKRLLLLSLVALAGCQTATKSDVATPQPPGDDACGATQYAKLVGTSGADVNESQFPAGTRVLRPGMVMTMDYRDDRLNVVIDEANKVDRVYCG